VNIERSRITLTVNGEAYEISVKVNASLLDVLRDELELTGTKRGCDAGDCGACTVIMDGKAVNACLVLAMKADGRDIVTIEGLARGDKLDPIQEAFLEKGGVQCGFCTPGMVLSAKALLDKNPKPTKEEIKAGIAGNLCRCTGYKKIIEAIQSAAQRRSEGK
jgi:aerobic carbon-monoxide dehydrogenase small subunit